MSKTYTEDEVAELQSKLDAAIARVSELETTQAQSAVDAKVAEATADLESKVAEIQSQLDAAVAAAGAATQERDDIVAFLKSEQEREAAEKAAEARKAERIAKVKEVASFPETYIDANAERWSQMEETAFEAVLEACREAVAAAGASTSTTTEIPAETAMETSRDNKTTTGAKGLLKEVMQNFRVQGIDPRSL